MLEIFPQTIQLFPGKRQVFGVRSRDLVPMWTRFDNGFVLPDRSVDMSRSSGGPSITMGAKDGAQQLVGGVGYFEFTLDVQSTPTDPAVGSNGSFSFAACFGGPSGADDWQYRVFIDPGGAQIRDETGTLIATLSHNVAIGDRFRVELNSGFRLFINDVLRHERVSGFTGGIHYPAFYRDVGLFQASSIGHFPRIPAPRLAGDWQLREKDSLGNPVVLFTAPSHGSIAVSGLQAEYFNATIPGNYKLSARIDTGVKVWVEDGPPSGSTVTSGGFSWVSSFPPLPFSGNAELRITNAAGTHQYFFNDATDTLQINPGDVLTCYVFLDAATPPQEVMLQYSTTADGGAFNHRAYWGANLIPGGTDGTPSRRFIDQLPPTGQWVRLEVAASLLGLEGHVIKGMAFSIFDGRCDFDQAGKYPGALQSAEVLITIPPMQITGPLVRTFQPGQKAILQTNYDVADVPPTWTIVSGGGSLIGAEFTAPTAPGMTVLRATAATGNQTADLTINIPAIITPNFGAAGPSEVVDFDTNMQLEPFFVSAGASAEGVGDITPGLPAGIQPKDVLLLTVESANELVPTPASWGIAADSPQGTGTAAGVAATRLSVFWLRVPQSGIVSAPLLTDVGDHQIARIRAYRNCIDTGNPWDVTAGSVAAAATTAVSINGDTTTVPNCLIVQAVAFATDIATPQVSGYANADLTSLTEQDDIATTQGNGGGFAIVEGRKPAVGLFAATTATLATASVQGRITIALKPPVVVWTASGGSINSGTGNWIAPSVLGSTVRITVTNGSFTAIRDVLIMEKFPLSNPSAPIAVDLNKTVLISISEDRSSLVARVKDKDGRSYRTQEVQFLNCELDELEDVIEFWEAHFPGKRFILEDNLRGMRIICYFDSNLRYEAESSCAINISFRVREA